MVISNGRNPPSHESLRRRSLGFIPTLRESKFNEFMKTASQNSDRLATRVELEKSETPFKPLHRTPPPSPKCIVLSLEQLNVIPSQSTHVKLTVKKPFTSMGMQTPCTSLEYMTSISLQASRQLTAARALLSNRKCSVNSLAEASRIVASSKVLRASRKRPTHWGRHFCRMRVLLVGMQLALGSSMSCLTIYLKDLSVSLTLLDCAYWASLPLLLLGLVSVSFCLPIRFRRRPVWLHLLTEIIAIFLSLVCIVLCSIASFFSGIHGNWISWHGGDCNNEYYLPRERKYCCTDNYIPANNNSRYRMRNYSNTSCICYTAVKGVDHRLDEYIYSNLNCRYVTLALKDYLILQCSLLSIGAITSLWLMCLLVKSVRTRLSPQSRKISRSGMKVLGPSPPSKTNLNNPINTVSHSRPHQFKRKCSAITTETKYKREPQFLCTTLSLQQLPMVN